MNQILSIAYKLADSLSAVGPETDIQAAAYMSAHVLAHGQIAALKQRIANDNHGALSGHLLDQLADIMAFMASRKNIDLSLLTLRLTDQSMS